MQKRRRYEFHRDASGVWALVFDCEWRIEEMRFGGAPVCLTVDQFEESPHGRKLSRKLAQAVQEAEADL